MPTLIADMLSDTAMLGFILAVTFTVGFLVGSIGGHRVEAESLGWDDDAIDTHAGMRTADARAIERQVQRLQNNLRAPGTVTLGPMPVARAPAPIHRRQVRAGGPPPASDLDAFRRSRQQLG